MNSKVFSAPHRLNRFLLLLVAFAFIAAGGAGIAAALGAFGSKVAHHTLYDNPPGRYVGDNGDWIWPVAAGISVLVALFALRWLFTQVHLERVGSMLIDACLLYTSPSPRDGLLSRMPSSA